MACSKPRRPSARSATTSPPCRRSRWGGGPCEAWWRGLTDPAKPPPPTSCGPPPHALRAQGGLGAPEDFFGDAVGAFVVDVDGEAPVGRDEWPDGDSEA